MQNKNLKIMISGSSTRPQWHCGQSLAFLLKQINMHCAKNTSGETREKRVAKKRENREHARSLALYLIVEVAVE